ncbi:hypothetical protein BDZ94DRAFT_1166190 [Collybia nuda]|uniref:Uncharacterized protein n=1 Tax=Collybia nuda TaxID=64659 RepID=A0A9P6CDZ3_9AGAR|nr:hypothetical protein BDZ94DRAFT_1166190 [Collybia nuda]
MPSLNITIEDTSPVISYSTGWRAGHSSGDQSANRYSQSSFTVTNVQGATASFSFNGTSVGIFGAKRGNHGAYQVKLDSTLYPPNSGKANDPGIFQTPLFSAAGLSQGFHTVTLTNQEGSFLDIDFITWETTVGTNSSGNFYVNTVQDTSPSFTYLPSETDWGVPSKNIGSFMGGSGHATTKSGASLTYSFDVGESVSLYGPVGPDGSLFAVHVDGSSASAYTTVQEFYTPQSLLYHASSLGPGSHNLTLICQPINPQQTFAVDYAVVFTTAAPLATPNLGCVNQVVVFLPH